MGILIEIQFWSDGMSCASIATDSEILIWWSCCTVFSISATLCTELCNCMTLEVIFFLCSKLEMKGGKTVFLTNCSFYTSSMVCMLTWAHFTCFQGFLLVRFIVQVLFFTRYNTILAGNINTDFSYWIKIN